MTTIVIGILGLMVIGLNLMLRKAWTERDSAKFQAWQDGHDTALINGQSQNPYEQEPR